MYKKFLIEKSDIKTNVESITTVEHKLTITVNLPLGGKVVGYAEAALTEEIYREEDGSEDSAYYIKRIEFSLEEGVEKGDLNMEELEEYIKDSIEKHYTEEIMAEPADYIFLCLNKE